MMIEKWLPTEIGQTIWTKKYRNENESLDNWFDRVSGGNEKLKKLIQDQKFLFGGRTLTNRLLGNGSYSNCYSSGYVLDDLDDIMKVNTKLALTYKAHGGQGVSLSKIRPKGSLIGGRYLSDGIVPFMEMYNTTTKSISQGGCISEDCRVFTNRGLIKIKDIIVGDKAWTKKGWIDINFLFDKGIQDVYEVKSKKGYKLETTIDHKFCVDGFRSSKLSDLKVGDKINLISGSINQHSNLESYLQTGEKVSSELAYFLGYFNGNGWISQELNAGTLTMHWNQVEIMNKLIDIIEFLGFSTYVCAEQEDSYRRLYLNKEFIDWLNKNNLIKNKTKYIEIPELIFTSNIDIITSYICGAIDSDGTIYETSFKYSSISEGYIDQLANLLKLLGFFPSINISYREGRQPLYEVSDGFRRNQVLLTDSIKYINSNISFTKNSKYRTPYTLENLNLKASETGVPHLKKVSKKSEIGLYSYIDINNQPYYPIIYDEIEEINYIGKKQVYDISLIEEHYFMCEGFYVSNSRKGALMLSLDIWHRECETFVTIKTESGKITNANLSVEIDDEFMGWVEKSYNDKVAYTIIRTQIFGEQIVQYEVVPITLYKLIMKSAWESAEPGVIFTNRFRNYNLMQYIDLYQIETCNPCGEQPLPKDGACNLGSINLSKYVVNPFSENAEIDWFSLEKDVQIYIEELDNLIDENAKNHAVEEQRIMAENYRNIGLGFMGLADMLIKLGIKYGSENSINAVSGISEFIFRCAIETSVELSASKGSFPKYEPSLFDSDIIRKYFSKEEIELFKSIGIRNCSLLSIAPTGSIGTMLNISGGIEPYFAFEFYRKTDSIEGDNGNSFKIYAEIVKEYIDYLSANNIIFGGKLPDYFVSAYDINWKDRIDLQAAAQNFIDTAISATINLPKNITVEEVEELYLYAWKKGLKGVTIYRDGCREGVLTINKESKPSESFATRGEELDAQVVHFLNEGKPWIAFIGIKENLPFEIFLGPSDIEIFPIPKSVTFGKIIKVKVEGEQTRYDFRYTDKYGYQNTLGGLSRIFDKEYWNYARLLSGLLRNKVDIHWVIDIVSGMYFESESLHSWKNGVMRALKSFIPDGTKTNETCPECGGDIVYTGGCKQCANCGWSKC